MKHKWTKPMYSIKDLERITGIRAHTIRIWEQRYDLLIPERTDTNIRRYDDDQLKKLVNVAYLVNQGWKISKVANLAGGEFIEAIEQEAANDTGIPEWDAGIRQLVVSMVDMDEVKFISTVKKFQRDYDFETIVTHLFYPFLEKVGILWSIGQINPSHEHFISNLVRQEMITAIAQLEVVTDPSKPVVGLFLPSGELHEIGLLFTHYLVRKKGLRTYYFGADLPLEYLESGAMNSKADHLLTFCLSEASVNTALTYYENLGEKMPDTSFLLCYNSAFYDGPIPDSVVGLSTLESFLDHNFV